MECVLVVLGFRREVILIVDALFWDLAFFFFLFFCISPSKASAAKLGV